MRNSISLSKKASDQGLGQKARPKTEQTEGHAPNSHTYPNSHTLFALTKI